MLGLFDSGIGGLTVVHEILKRYPQQSFVYLGDSARAPYGNKSRELIEQYAIEDTKFLADRGATDMIVACNTVSSVALERLRKEFPSIRFFDVITPAIQAAANLNVKKIGVIGTRATIGSGVYASRIADLVSCEVISIACPLFVPLVEEGWVNKPETKKIVRQYLAPLRQKQIDALILGCTHYPLLQSVIRSSLHRRVKIIDSASALIDQMEREAPEIFNESACNQQFFFSDTSSHLEQIVRKWLGKNICLNKAII